MVWYSHLLKNFPQFAVIHTVKGLGIVNNAEVNVFLELSCFFNDPADTDDLISGCSAFSKCSLNIWKLLVHVWLKPGLEGLEALVVAAGGSFVAASASVVAVPQLVRCVARVIFPDHGPDLCSLHWQVDSYLLHDKQSPIYCFFKKRI